MSKLPLVEGIIKYLRENNSMLCMPGHKSGRGFKNTDVGKELYENFIKADITEVDGVDNLHHPEGIIKEAENMLRDFYGSKKSYFLVNGSTSGNLAMIFSCLREGEKVIVERNCHRSIFNGIIMRKLKPVYIKNKIYNKFNAPLSIDEDYLIDLFDNNLDAKAVIITYPNYYGVCCNLKFIVKEAHKRGIKVLVDSAHGAHFGAHNELPQHAVNLGGDFVVMSSHKTLPSLTQTAYLHIGQDIDTEKVDFYVSAFLSTSPSYMLMCSMDYARYYLQEKGTSEYKKLIDLCNYYREKINLIEGFHIISREDLQNNIDVTRYILNVKDGLSGYKLYEYLKSKKIQPEMCDGNNVILIFSTFNTEEEFELLYKSLLDCKLEAIKLRNFHIIESGIADMKIMPFEAVEKEYRLIHYSKAQGELCRDSIVPYPPGIPIILPGEIINKNTIKAIEYYLREKCTVLGINKDGEIKIID
ncbi:aminotransferase class I/II-fold pyridoxal phosphate-dependent enzyme [Clostridium pasteurianum]|uniref:Arginine/lysine/ornithine decarboxylase n=1 Tax=Clostridium pasteurianum BC1 TaxID=86416 RepID=R4K6H8_CLOPA|nr:aminotransferase class V-fold PLP-dependent enzyme [Clostridium pasteurianum]AGK95255.1 arginine/lysine/ornithine decarboxylase [Clostridium pasteurianum BC1]